MKISLQLVCLFTLAVYSQEPDQLEEAASVELCTNGTEDSCEAFNSSDSTTSPAAEVTSEVTKSQLTTKKSKTTTAKSGVKKVTSAPNVTSPLKPHRDCSCDTSRGGCEINCCCDVDCSVEQRAVFTSCVRVPHVIDSEHCFPQQLLYHNNTDYQAVQTDPGVFCVLHHNTLSSTDYIDVPVIRSVAALQAKLGRHKHYSWPNPLPVTPVFDVDEGYNDASPVWITNNLTIKYLELPASVGHSTLCHSSVRPKYLEEIETSCTVLIRTKSECLASTESRFAVISSPRNFNFTQPQDCTEDICLPVQNHICSNKSPKSCSEGTVHLPVFNESSKVCQNLTSSLEFKLYHNGSQGIVEVKAFYTLQNISVSDSRLFRKRYKVSYVWAGSTDHPVLKRSGRPGYDTGKPVVSGKRVNKALVYNSSASDWISVGVSGSSGYCADRYNLLFGENLRTQCLLAVNGTCTQIQQQIWQQLLGPSANLSEVMISSYGDPRGEDKEAWVPLLSADQPPTPALTTAVEIIIVHSLVGNIASPQAKIVAAYLHLLPSTTTCDSNQTTVTLETSVKFIDKTTPAVTKFAEPPVYEIKLPRDFFYPFLSAAGKTDISKTTTFFIVLYVLMLS